MSLAVRLTTIFLTLSVIPLAIIGYIGFIQVRDTIEQNVRLKLSSVTTLQEALYNQWITDQESRLSEMSNRSSFQALVSTILQQSSSTLEQDVARERLIKEHLSPGIEEITGFVALVLQDGSTGNALAYSPDLVNSPSIASYQDLNDLKNSTQLEFTPQSVPDLPPRMILSVPIKLGASNETVTILAAHLDLEEMAKVLKQRNTLGIFGETYLLSESTFFLTDPITAGGFSVRSSSEVDQIERCLNKPADISLYNNRLGNPVIGAQRWMQQWGLCIRTEISQAKAYGQVAQLRNMVLGIGTVVALVVSIIGFFLARSITRPVEGLLEGIEEVGSGNLRHQIPGWSAGDEIGKLTRAFNHMTQNLRSITTSRNELNKEVSERKKAEATLEEKAEELLRSNMELEQFAYVASHDLQEPLRMIASYLQLIDRRYRGKLDSQADEFIEFAVDGAHRMQKLISDLLIFSRIGTESSDLKIVDSSKILGEAINNLELAIKESNARITSDTLPSVKADPKQLSRLFQNIIGNSIKYRGEQELEIHVRCRKEANYWVFSIRDNGIGIELQYQQQIFGIFERLHNHTQYSGTGIGLAICKKIVERHGGQIWVKSTLGSHSIFYFNIPDIEDTNTES